MSLPELSTPIRIYWDITPVPLVHADHLKIAEYIIALKILNLDIAVTGESIPDSCFTIIKKCSEARIGITLTVSAAFFTKLLAESLSTAPPKELLLEITSIEEIFSLDYTHPAVSGFSFPINENNWKQIPDLIHFVSEKGIKRLVFPMQRLYSGEHPFHLPAQGIVSISDALSSLSPAPLLQITAHDPFVWRAIFPNTPFPNGRCQAANTMLYIDPKGVVYPCPVMPVPIGDLQITTLKEIAKGVIKRELRAKLLKLPADCIGCEMAESCKGGCRGRGEIISGSWDGIDPACK
ncbi:MAG: SPASM domain-containing protein [Geobacteraceae bacterium]|nr:SPASM domain-containing protein [Geobacteraceae bacterium]